MTAPPSDLTGDDAALIERSWHDPQAFAGLYDRHAAVIHRYATQRLGAGMADDVVAETFLAAFRRRHKYDLSRTDARPWLYGIAANEIGKHRRAEVRLLRAFARAAVDGVTEGHADVVAEQVTAAAARRKLAAALAALPARERDVLLLIAWADLSYSEVAVALRIPVGTVRSRLSSARRRARTALGGQDPTLLREELIHE